MARMTILDADRKRYRRKFLEDMIPRLGYALPIHSHVDARQAEWEVLDELVNEGKLIVAQQRVDRHGHANSQGRSTRPIYVGLDASRDDYLKRRHCITVTR